jgi:signal transduction histidine kinase
MLVRLGRAMQFYLFRAKNWICRKFRCKRSASRKQSNLMDRLSHELRTSLTGIVGYSEFVESSSAEPMVNFTAKIIRESSLSLARASNSFFDLHRLELGQIQIDPTTFSISELVRDVVRIYQKQALDQTVRIAFTCSAETFFCEMFSDAQRVHQVVDALIFGAVQSSKKGSSIHVDLSIDEDKSYVRLMLIAVGAPSDGSHEELNKKFWNGECYKFRLQAGPGVELALAQALIYFLQGYAEYQVRPGEHPRLIVWLPLRYKKSKVSV